jgi:hypothetical protein
VAHEVAVLRNLQVSYAAAAGVELPGHTGSSVAVVGVLLLLLLLYCMLNRRTLFGPSIFETDSPVVQCVCCHTCAHTTAACMAWHVLHNPHVILHSRRMHILPHLQERAFPNNAAA